jgi:hypothetical protein
MTDVNTNASSDESDELILLGDSLPPEEVPVPITSNDGSKVRKFIFKPLDAGTLRGYRQRLTGIGKRKGDSIQANAFVFERLFLRVDGLDKEEEEAMKARSKTAKAIFLGHKRYAVLIDNVTTRYLNEVYNLGEVTEDIKG